MPEQDKPQISKILIQDTDLYQYLVRIHLALESIYIHTSVIQLQLGEGKEEEERKKAEKDTNRKERKERIKKTLTFFIPDETNREKAGSQILQELSAV